MDAVDLFLLVFIAFVAIGSGVGFYLYNKEEND